MKRRNRNEVKVSGSFIIVSLIAEGVAIGLSIASALTEGVIQSIFIGLTTGIMSSAVVSFAVWAMQKDQERVKANNCRRDFMMQFKILSYKLINNVNMAQNQDTKLSLKDYIKLQHRWFHDYYKRIVAENTTESETELRIKQITQFIEKYERNLRSIFESRIIWEDGNFSDWQLKELKDLYEEFCDCKDYIERNNYKYAFLSFASFLEIFKRVMTEDSFNELEYFNLMQFNYNENGTLTINEEEFNDQEKMFKFAKDFNKIRMENYKKYYGEFAENVNEEQSNG